MLLEQCTCVGHADGRAAAVAKQQLRKGDGLTTIAGLKEFVCDEQRGRCALRDCRGTFHFALLQASGGIPHHFPQGMNKDKDKTQSK